MLVSDPVTVEGTMLDRSWITPRDTARIHLLPAFKAPICVVLLRRRSKWFHVLKWNLLNDELTSGSWFHGKLYIKRCDVSWDGQWMVYLAMGSDAKTWNGLCCPPWLKTSLDSENVGSWAGGGVFTGPRQLEANTMWHAAGDLAQGSPPGGLKIVRIDSGGEDLPVLFKRMQRDGWKRNGDRSGEERQLKSLSHKSFVANVGDDGWSWRPTQKHPTLRTWYRGYFERGYTFEFAIDEYPGFLDALVEWATWSSSGDLLFARDGVINRCSLASLEKETPVFSRDCNVYVPPKLPR
ncbi:MAG: hypothetical protein AB7U20_19505 [Planctomycetaceae bacterium]